MLAHSLVASAHKEIMAKLDVDTRNPTQSQQGSFQRHLHKEGLEEACIPLLMLL